MEAPPPSSAAPAPPVTSKKPHFVLLCSPGMGHLIPVLELSSRLVAHHDAAVTVFLVASSSSQAETELATEAAAAATGAAPGGGNFFHVVKIPPPDLSAVLDPTAAVVTRLCVIMRELIPAIRSAVRSLPVRPDGLIVDLFGTECFVVAEELGIPKYLLGTSNAWFTALAIHTPVLDRQVEGEYIDQKEPLKVPGCRSVRPDEVVDPMLDRKDQVYTEFRRMGFEFGKADGILINTWEDLESTTLAALRNDKFFGRRVIQGNVVAIGPVVRPIKPTDSTGCEELFSWLDKQPKESVVYVCFGSAGNLSIEQNTELAWGLERSGQRFVWVVRPPTGVKDSGFFSSGKSGDNGNGTHLLAGNYGLPEGFLERTRHVGLVVPDWVPQSEVLSHVAVGGFVCHGGWNSTLEGIRSGVPMMMWPLYSEQRMNATLVAEELRLAARTKTMPWRGVIGREEVERMIREVMVGEEGKGIRERVKAAQRSGEKALEVGVGSSYKALDMIINRSRYSIV